MKTPLILRTLSQFSKLRWHRTLPQLYCCSYQLASSQNSNYISLKCYSTKPVENMEEVYTGAAGKQIFYVKCLSVSTSVAAVMIQSAIFMRMDPLNTIQSIACSAMCIFTFVTPGLIHLLFRRYVVKLYFNKENDTYTAVVYNLFGFKRKITFTVEDVEKLSIEVLSTVKVKGFPLYMDPKHFTDVYHYKRILGYDKPIDINQGMSLMSEELEQLRTQREKNLQDESVDEKPLDVEDTEKKGTSHRL